MALTEGQVQIRDLVVGPGTPFRFVRGSHFNPFARSTRADQSAARSWADGSWSGAEWAEQITVPMRLVVLASGPAEYAQRMHELLAAFAPSHVDVDLAFVLGGVEYVMPGRPRMVDPESRHLDGHVYAQAAFVALTPRIWSAAQTVLSTGLPSSVGGLTWPVAWPVTVSPLNANPYLESDAADWAAAGATIARSTAQAHEGVASLQITPDGTSASGGANAITVVPILANQQYRAQLWAYATQTMQVGPAVDWRDGAGAYVSTSFVGPVTVPATTWTLIDGVVTAPAGAGQAVMRARHAGTPPASAVWHADEIVLSELAGGLTWNAQVATGTIQAFNAGTVDTPPRLVITGPCPGPRVVHVGLGRTLAWDITLAAGQWLDVDVARRTSLLNGQVSRAGLMTSREWFELPPGYNEIAFGAQLYDPAAELSVAYQSAWR